MSAATAIAIPPDDLRAIHANLSFDEARRLKLSIRAIAAFDEADDKARAADSIRARLEPLGVRGLSIQSLYRKSALAKKHGWRGIVDGRTLRRIDSGGLQRNAEFVAHWHSLVAQNQRKTAPAWRALLSSINRGDSIPGLGTWRDIWARENPGLTLPSECPYGIIAPADQIPIGMSYTALMRIKPTAFGIAAARIGTDAAITDFAPDIIRTRVGLRRCQVIQVDDMWHNAKVMFGGNKFAERVVELSAVDLLSGCIICHLAKPIIREDDGTRKTLRSEWLRYILAHIICDLGYPGKMLIMGEHGMATATADLKATLNQISGGTITFGAGGLLSQPIAKGLYEGRPKGNPKYKGLIESLHSAKQNALAQIPGQIGSRDSLKNEPEKLYGMEKHERALAAAVIALESARPGIRERLAWPWISYGDYGALVAQYYAELDNRTWHAMEGWEECGFIAAEWRPMPGQPWMPMDALQGMGDAAQAMLAAIRANPQLFRQRRMSPREAWQARAGDVQRLGDWAAPLILGEALARECEVSPKLMMAFRDESTMADLSIYAIVDGMPLPRGAKYKVWVNPLSPGKAYVADLKGRYIGIAKVVQAANPDDFEALKKSLGVRQQAITAEIKKLRPIAQEQLRRANAAAAKNAVEILGYDPAAQLAYASTEDSAIDRLAQGYEDFSIADEY